MLAFAWLLISSLPAPPQTATVPDSTQLQTRQVDVWDYVPLPACDNAKAIASVQGQLVTTDKARINGLSDIHEVTYDTDKVRLCQARVNLAFGTQSIAYAIRRLPPGGRPRDTTPPPPRQ